MFSFATQKQPMLASGTRTSGGTSNGHNAGSWLEARMIVDVTAASGTSEKLTIHFDSSWDNSDYFVMPDLGRLEITKIGKYTFPITNFGKYVRVRYEITGTSASFTFKVDIIYKG